MDGNTLTSVKTSAGTALNSSQYSMPGGTLTLSGIYLATLYNFDSAPGIKETLTLTFSSGTSLTLQSVQYSTPTMVTTTYKIDNSTNIHMPITYAGLSVAAVKAILADGSFLVDDWTKYLGPLRQGRWTFADWSCDKRTFPVTVRGLQMMKAANQTVALTLEVSNH
jgi:endoglucanase